MTVTDRDVQTSWDIDDIVDFMSDGRHSMHLTTEANEYQTGEGRKEAPSITATCTCGKSISGLQDAAQVFAVIKEHCRPV